MLTLGLKNSNKVVRLLISYLLTVGLGFLFVSNDFVESYTQAISKFTLYVILSLSVVLIGFRWYKKQRNQRDQYFLNDYEEDFYDKEPLRDKLIRQFLLVITSIVFGLIFLLVILDML